MMHGTWDANAFNTLNDAALTEISGISKLAEKFNIIRGAEGNAAANRI